ncbi:TetR/AcrR family transcriptional regulator [Aciditerrimonas ferrireducens]|uniref:TetR/AcrR family transcriptional regulator n=1 Tax=Aciditerrimonas ferrireducens TaxID=667306 RepID=UPI0020062652|nr:TetR/AcrR family transcriptional regulator [Aciditerrimonas ferrireducens]MCK4177168.1 TetR/AcrR family transcriptional regulator [Aciditerrimonas ferrireducens]
MAEAALALFCERGYHAVTVDDIVQAAGVTKGAFYYYFADKEDLATDLWRRSWRRLADAAAGSLREDLGLAENLKRSLRAMLDALSGLGEARFFLRDAWVLPSVEVAGRVDQEEAGSLLGSLLAEAQARGELTVEATAATKVLLGAFAEGVLHVLTVGEVEPTLAVLDRVVDALVEPAPRAAGPARRARGDQRAGVG